MKKIQKRPMKLSVNLLPTNETFKLERMFPTSVIGDVRSESEISAGIPAYIQHLYYLDKCDLVDTSTVQSNDVVSGATLMLDIWHNWVELITAAALGNLNIFHLGVTPDSDYSTPSSSILNERDKLNWLLERANMALLVACHRGHLDICRQLINQGGANVNWTTKLGRSPLHLAAARGQTEIITELLANGADLDAPDKDGNTPMSLATKYGHKQCERHLFMFRWQQRAKQMVKPQYINPPPMAFQIYDTFLPQWKIGPTGQVYYEKKMPPGEFIGSALNAPKREWHRRGSSAKSSPEESEKLQLKMEKSVSFDSWRKQKERQKKLKAELKIKQEEAEKLVFDEKRRARIERLKSLKGSEETLRDVTISAGSPENGIFADDGDWVTSDLDGSRRLKPIVDTKTRIKQVLAKYGLVDNDGVEEPMTVYDQWQQQRRNMGKTSVDDEYLEYLPYQQMIKEFCAKKCH